MIPQKEHNQKHKESHNSEDNIAQKNNKKHKKITQLRVQVVLPGQNDLAVVFFSGGLWSPIYIYFCKAEPSPGSQPSQAAQPASQPAQPAQPVAQPAG